MDSAWLSASLAFATATVAAVGVRRTWGTTLAAPAVWCVISALTVAAVETEMARRGATTRDFSSSLCRYAAAASTLCPIMAVLGSKRPQDRGWQWIVLSLWIVLLVPAGQAMAAPTGQRLEIAGAWRAMLIALAAMELWNYLPTRQSLAAMLITTGQVMLLTPYLTTADVSASWRNIGLFCVLMAAISAIVMPMLLAKSSRASSLGDRLGRLQCRWFALRDGWGAFWGLRILQRVNQTAELSRWPLRLHWSGGFVAESNTPIDDMTLAHVEQTLDSLLRRFERVE
jgi:hypothetical protein